jgi:hypothetical protein
MTERTLDFVLVVAATATDHRSEEVLHTFCRRPPSVRSKSLNSNVIEFHGRIRRGVCDNLSQTARKLLILKMERCPSG